MNNNDDVVRVRKIYPTAAQKARLVSLLEADAELRRGKFSPSFTKKVACARWCVIGEELNSIPGVKKKWNEWRKTWQDMKSKAKKKQAVVRRSANLTGGGSPTENLTEQDELIISTISNTALVGHSDSQESVAIFNWDGEVLETPSVASTSYEAPPTASHVVEDASPQAPTQQEPTQQNKSQQTTDNAKPQNQQTNPKRKKTSATFRFQKSIETAIAINQSLQNKNDINRMKVEEMRNQTKAVHRQADAMYRQAVALEQLIKIKEAKMDGYSSADPPVMLP